jgi:hypothetical protein
MVAPTTHPLLPGWRLTGAQALRAATLLERAGWRAESVPLAQG